MKKEISNSLSSLPLLLENNVAIAVIDQDGYFVSVNEKFNAKSQYTTAELIGQPYALIDASFKPDVDQRNRRRDAWAGDTQHRAKDGSFYFVHTTMIPTPATSELIILQLESRVTSPPPDRQYERTMVNLPHTMIFKYEASATDGITFTYLSGGIAQKLGFMTIGAGVTPVFINEMSRFTNHLNSALQGATVQFEYNYGTYTLLIDLTPVLKEGQVIEVIGTAIDISKQKQTERDLEKLAYYDHLTGLPNRRRFQMEVEETIERAALRQDIFSVLFLDVDDLKRANDILGHAFGDKLLQTVSDKLSTAVGARGFTARLGGDEFVVLLPTTNADQAEEVIEAIHKEMAKQCSIDGIDHIIGVSIGKSVFSKDGTTYDQLIDVADSEMYREKEMKRKQLRASQAMHQ